ncbi:TIGR00341 family protein [Brevundimonas sp.]|uniref:TIGR00341 family protein n=1 Tax=Brevundimonas sp. TaxID=1871086 RepID=UPI002FDA334D
MTSGDKTVRDTRNLARRILARARRQVDHGDVAQNVYDNGGLSGRYLIMSVISAAIAILGLMLSSPAVVIGAMLVSPMMGPIVALGFSLALLDFGELKQALQAIVVGLGVALLVSVILTLVSPLKEPTAEILARTRPNFFDLLIAVFSGVAGAYAVIKQRGETIIGVAIATALMPPVATVGFGIGTGDLRIAGGAFFLFMTNLVAIALAATLTAGFYGFRPRLGERSGQARWRGLAVVVVFALLSAPLVLSLRAIGLESRAMAETRLAVSEIFKGADSRITVLDVRSDHDRIDVSTLVSTRTLVADAESRLNDRLTAALHTPVQARLDQIVVADPRAAARAVQVSQGAAPDPIAALRSRLIEAVPFATDAVMLDGSGSRALILLRPDSGLDLNSAYALEKALQGRFQGMAVWVAPPLTPFEAVDLGDPAAVERAAWALARWRASPAVSFCRPAPAPALSPDAPAEAPPPQSDRERFVAALAVMGVLPASTAGPACRRGDVNLARIALG